MVVDKHTLGGSLNIIITAVRDKGCYLGHGKSHFVRDSGGFEITEFEIDNSIWLKNSKQNQGELVTVRDS